jgi:hypothetical protein
MELSPELVEQYVKTYCDQMRIGYKYQFKKKNSPRLEKAWLLGFSVRTLENGFMEISYDFESELDEEFSCSNNDIDETTLMEMIPFDREVVLRIMNNLQNN